MLGLQYSRAYTGCAQTDKTAVVAWIRNTKEGVPNKRPVVLIGPWGMHGSSVVRWVCATQRRRSDGSRKAPKQKAKGLKKNEQSLR